MNKNRIIALLPFRNEEWILPTYLCNVLPLADEIIAIDDGSTDNGRKILESCEKTTVYNNEILTKNWWAEFSIRQKLLQLGREAGGTHFICLDADEALSTNFLKVARLAINKLEPGQKLAMQWLPMWKSPIHYRDDNSIWSSIWKDFIFRDAPNLEYPYAEFGIARTPGLNTEEQWLKLKQEHGVCMHFSFSRWEHFQYKSCWYRCSELIAHPNWGNAINDKYKITLDSKSYVKECPNHWVEGMPLPDLDLETESLHLKEIKKFFEVHGPDFFSGLEIWHMPEIRKIRDDLTQR